MKLPAVRDTAPDGTTLYRLYDEETVRWWRQATYENQPYLVPSSAAPKVLADFEDLAREVQALRAEVRRIMST